jgi:hypothetical protein
MSASARVRTLSLTAALALVVPTALLALAGPAHAAAPALRIADLSVGETQSLVTKTVAITRSAPTTTAVSVRVRSVVGTAKAADFTAITATRVYFSAGQTTKLVTVRIAGDVLDEANEYFSLLLDSPSGATIADSSGRVTIVDNDAAPTVQVPAQDLAEGSAGLVNRAVNVTLSAPSGQTVSVAWAVHTGTAVSGDDFEPGNGRVTFPAGTTTRQLLISVDGDVLDEPTERLYVGLTSPVNTSVPTTYRRLNLIDDDSPRAPVLFTMSPQIGQTTSISLRGSAPSGLVQLYASSSCFGSPIRTVTPEELASGVSLVAVDNATTTLSAKSQNAGLQSSGCSNDVFYQHDDLAPSAPSGFSFPTASPKNDNNPELKGTTEPGTSVLVFKDACSSSPVVKGTQALFGGAGITVPVLDNSSNVLRVQAVDAAGNRSVCASAGTFVEDSIAPAVLPALSYPASGVGTMPLVSGVAEAGSLVEVYAFEGFSGTCQGLITTMSAAQFATGARIPFPPRSQTTRVFVVRDPAGNAAACTSSTQATYSETSTEIEPNNTSAAATPGSIAPVGTQFLTGELNLASDIDFFSVTIPAGGGILQTETSAVPNGPGCSSGLDTVVQVFNPAGTLVVSDDDAGVGFCSKAVREHVVAGKHTISVNESSLGSGFVYPMSYQLRVTVIIPNMKAEIESNDTPGAADPMGQFSPATPLDATGTIPGANIGDVDYFSFTLSALAPVTLEIVDGASSTCTGAGQDTFITLYGSDGTTVLASAQDGGQSLCSRLNAGALGAGTYFVKVQQSPVSVATSGFSYRLVLR